eukprot:TRINITY_DN4641_c0_g1_i1.p1 TRINITY_DN4641_c0_g1~~TRINITY_DN4641_c0_g1_i1.p1  ORF type:complete len:384 (+),score=147.69 TRINITY_DN4641_c0_g1_i1:54-1154(+)
MEAPLMEEDTLDVLRSTVEYKAAWEVELWKKREQENFVRKMEEEVKAAVKTRLEVLEQRERELEESYKMKLRSAAKAEDKAVREQAETKEKRMLLNEVEKALRRKKEELEREYSLRSKEWEDKIRRNKEEAAHKVSMEQLKQRQQAATITELKKRLHDVEAKHKELWESISKSKQEELQRHPTTFIKEAVAEVEEKHRQVSEAREREWGAKELTLQKKISNLTSINVKLRELLNAATLEAQTYKEALSKATSDAALLTAETLTLTRQKTSPPPEPTPDDRDQPDTFATDFVEVRKYLPPILCTIQPGSLAESDRHKVTEIARLGKEKERLLATGCYTEADGVLVSLTHQQQKLIHMLVAASVGKAA